MDTKIYIVCEQGKTLDNFHRSSAAKDGYKTMCKDCKLVADRKYRDDPRYREKRLERKRQYTKNHREESNASKRAWYDREPWRKTHKSIMSRCYHKDHWYSNRGIQNSLTPDDLKMLWFRDKAHDMEKPSIDRIDSNKDYTIDNCRYIEMRDNKPWRNNS